MATRKTAAPVANLREAKKAQAQARAAHPAGKQAPAKKVAAPAAPVEKVTYTAQSRSGKTNTRASATPLSHAVDVKIANRKGAAFGQGVVVAFYASLAAAEKVVAEINSGNVTDFSDAVVVPVQVA